MVCSLDRTRIEKITLLFTERGYAKDVKDYLLNFTNHRKSKIDHLTELEADLLIQFLGRNNPCEALRTSIVSLAFAAGILYGTGADDTQINEAALNVFLKRNGIVKKPLPELTFQELVQVHRQMELKVKSRERYRANRRAATLTNKLLTELNLTVKK